MQSSSSLSSYPSYTLELTIQSAEALTTTGKRPIRRKTFVAISTEGGHQMYTEQQQQQQQQYETECSEEGGSNPVWNEKREISITTRAKYIVLEVYCAISSKSKEKRHSIGLARVPVSDFIGNYYNNSIDYVHFLSYRLRDRFGDPNGIINFSVKVKGTGKMHQPVESYTYNKVSTDEIGGWSGYNKGGNYGHGTNSTCVVGVDGWRNSSPIVVGVPAHLAW